TPEGRSSDAPSDRFLELLGSPEGDFLRRLDLDRFAGCGVAAHARGALAHLQNAEAADADALALLQMLDDITDEIAEHGLCLLLRHFVLFIHRRSEMLQSNRCRRRFSRSRCHWRTLLVEITCRAKRQACLPA